MTDAALAKKADAANRKIIDIDIVQEIEQALELCRQDGSSIDVYKELNIKEKFDIGCLIITR